MLQFVLDESEEEEAKPPNRQGPMGVAAKSVIYSKILINQQSQL